MAPATQPSANPCAFPIPISATPMVAIVVHELPSAPISSNIINAEDMFDIWDGMNINVTRIDRGTPKEIKLFAKTIDQAEGKVDKSDFEKIKKLIRSIA